MSYRICPLILLFAVLVSGCVRHGEDYVVPDGHPASVTARPGLAPPPTSALEPELQTVKSVAGGSAPARPRSGGHQHH